MYVKVIGEGGMYQALVGLSLSYNTSMDKTMDVAKRLCMKGDGHNKFLESAVVWLDIEAPRYWWQQFDTYRVGVTKQSESTMHTITRWSLKQHDFEHPIPKAHLDHLNSLIKEKDWEGVKRDLPESFLQRRVVCTNYLTLQRMVKQRGSHKLAEWSLFIEDLEEQLMFPTMVFGEDENQEEDVSL